MPALVELPVCLPNSRTGLAQAGFSCFWSAMFKSMIIDRSAVGRHVELMVPGNTSTVIAFQWVWVALPYAPIAVSSTRALSGHSP